MKKIFVFILMVIVVSCGQETAQYSYYPSGEVAEKKLFSNKKDTSTYLLTEYYRNGQIKNQGNVINSLREGVWNEWYADGDILWSAKYINGYLQPSDTIGYPKFLFSDSLIAGKLINMRVFVEGAHRNDLLFGCLNAKFYHRNDSMSDLYDWIVVPDSSGYMYIVVYASNKAKKNSGVIQTVDSFYVYPGVTD